MNNAATLALLDDVGLFFDEFVDDVERCAAALGAGIRAELVLLCFEVTRKGFSPRRPRLLPCGALLGRFLGGLRRGLARVLLTTGHAA